MSRQNITAKRPAEFNYGQLDPKIAEQAKATAARVRETICHGIAVIIEVGQHLIDLKAHLSHGQFGEWLRLEFGWNRRSAEKLHERRNQVRAQKRNYFAFGYCPNRCIFIGGASTPIAARDEAIQLAEKGEKITPGVVRKIITRHRKKAKNRKKEPIPEHQLEQQLKLLLHGIRNRWNPKKLDALAAALVNFASSLTSELSQPNRTRQKAK